MKRIFVTGFVAILLLSVIVAYQVQSSTKRIVQYSGALIDTMVNADSDTKLSDRFVLTRNAASGDVSFDQILFGFDVPNMDSINATGDVNAVDSVIIRVIAGTGANTDTLVSTTKSALPATFTMSYTSTDSVWLGRPKLLHDMIWFSAYVVDSAGSGSGDSLRYTVNYWIKLIEKD